MGIVELLGLAASVSLLSGWRLYLTVFATGLAMYFGTLLIVLWLGAAALGDGPFAVVNAIFGFWLVQVILFFATWALFLHLLGGIRYLIWDRTQMMDPAGRELIVRLQLGGSAAFTILAWVLFIWLK